MAFKNNYIDDLDELLNRYRVSVSMKDTVLKKNKAIFNSCLKELKNSYENKGIDATLLNVILSIDAKNYQDSSWLHEHIFDDEIKRILRDEAIDTYDLGDAKSKVDLLDFF